MSNPFQDQLLKAGLVTKQQVLKAKRDKHMQTKQQRGTNTATVDETTVDETKARAQQIVAEKADQARDANKLKEEQSRQKALNAEITQIISSHLIKRNEGCELGYNFEHEKKVKTIYINADMKQQIINGKIGITCLDNRYELVPRTIAEKIKQRNDKAIILYSDNLSSADVDDPYAKYKIPDDLMW